VNIFVGGKNIASLESVRTMLAEVMLWPCFLRPSADERG